MRTYFALLLVAVVAFAATPITAPQAQFGGVSNGSLNFNDRNSFDFGVLPGFSGGFGGGVEPILEVGVSTGGGADFLGCAGVDLFSFSQTTFNFNFDVDRFVQNLRTRVAKWALTQLLATPQIAAVFDTLNQLENFRWDQFNESCDIGEIEEDALNIFVKSCAKQTGQSEAICRGRYDEESTNLLKNAANQYLNFDRSFKSLLDVLPGTDFCKGAGGAQKGAVCALSAFIPQMRFCHASDTGGAGCKTVGGIDFGDTPLGAPILLEASYKVFGDRVFGVVDNMLQQQIDANGLAPLELGASRLGSVDLLPPHDISTLSTTAQEYTKFVGCRQVLPFARERQLASLLNGGNGLTDTGSFSDFPQFATDIRSDLNAAGLAAGFQVAGLSADEASELITVAMACVANEKVNPPLSYRIGLFRLPRSERQNQLAAFANESAIVTVTSLLRYTQSKLSNAQAQFGIDRDVAPVYAGDTCPTGDAIATAEALNPRMEAIRREAGDPVVICDDIELPKPQIVGDGFRAANASLERQLQILEDDQRSLQRLGRFATDRPRR